MHKTKLLSDVARVRLGLAFKTAIQDLGEDGSCYLIQTKDITPDGNIELEKLAKVEPEISPQNHYLEVGDILLRLRGPVFSAAILDGPLSTPVLTTNQTAVIRCNPDFISPYYLQWYLNSPLGQHYFTAMNEGTSLAKISAKIVSNMKLKLPLLAQQQKIEVIHKNWLAQKETHKRLIDNGELYFDQLCMQIQNGK